MIIGVNGQGVENAAACDVHDLLSQNMTQDRVLTVLTPYCRDEETDEVLLTGDVPDIPDFEWWIWDSTDSYYLVSVDVRV